MKNGPTYKEKWATIFGDYKKYKITWWAQVTKRNFGT